MYNRKWYQTDSRLLAAEVLCNMSFEELNELFMDYGVACSVDDTIEDRINELAVSAGSQLLECWHMDDE